MRLCHLGIEVGIKGSKRCDVHLSSQKVRDWTTNHPIEIGISVDKLTSGSMLSPSLIRSNLKGVKLQPASYTYQNAACTEYCCRDLKGQLE